MSESAPVTVPPSTAELETAPVGPVPSNATLASPSRPPRPNGSMILTQAPVVALEGVDVPASVATIGVDVHVAEASTVQVEPKPSTAPAVDPVDSSSSPASTDPVSSVGPAAPPRPVRPSGTTKRLSALLPSNPDAPVLSTDSSNEISESPVLDVSESPLLSADPLPDSSPSPSGTREQPPSRSTSAQAFHPLDSPSKDWGTSFNVPAAIREERASSNAESIDMTAVSLGHSAAPSPRSSDADQFDSEAFQVHLNSSAQDSNSDSDSDMEEEVESFYDFTVNVSDATASAPGAIEPTATNETTLSPPVVPSRSTRPSLIAGVSVVPLTLQVQTAPELFSRSRAFSTQLPLSIDESSATDDAVYAHIDVTSSAEAMVSITANTALTSSYVPRLSVWHHRPSTVGRVSVFDDSKVFLSITPSESEEGGVVVQSRVGPFPVPAAGAAASKSESQEEVDEEDFVCSVSIVQSVQGEADLVQVSVTVAPLVVGASDPSSSLSAAVSPQGPSSPSSASSPKEASSSTTYLISKEILDTETRFVGALQTLQNVIISPSTGALNFRDERLMGSVIFDTRVQVFFSTASQILKLNLRFLNELRGVVDAWTVSSKLERTPPSSRSVAGVFCNYAPLFAIFSSYAREHESVSALLLSSASTPGTGFQKYVDKAMAEAKFSGQTLESLLIQPIQRVPRYKLLLEELKRKSLPTDSGYAELLKAIEQVSAVAMAVNESIRHREQNEALRMLEDQFITPTIGTKISLRDREPPRSLVREGALKRLTRKGATTYYFHLFDDLLLYSEEALTTSSEKVFKLHRRVNFNEPIAITDKSVIHVPASPTSLQADEAHVPNPRQSVDESSSKSPVSPSPVSASTYAIEVRSPAKSFVVSFTNASEKNCWLGDMERCVAAVRAQQSGEAGTGSGTFVAPVWTQDQNAAACGLCKKGFTLFNRRHHCRKCGTLCCEQCSLNKRNVPSVDSTRPVRVCDTCVREEHASRMSVAEAPNAGPSSATSPIKAVGEKSVASIAKIQKKIKRNSTMKNSGISTLLTAQTPASLVRQASTRQSMASSVSNAAQAEIEPISGLSALTPVPAPAFQRSELSAEELDAQDDLLVPPYRHALYALSRAYPNDERLLSALELYLSEICYCRELEVLLSVFVTPLLKQMTVKKGLLGSGSATTLAGKPVPPELSVFLNSFQPLYTLARELHKCLYSKIVSGDDPSSTHADDASFENPAGWNPQTTTFGELFLRYSQLFAMYAEYSQSHQQALRLLTDPEGPFRDTVYSLYENSVRQEMEMVVEEQHLRQEASKRKEKQWKVQDSVMHPKRPAAASKATTLQVETVDMDSIHSDRGATLTQPIQSTSRLSMATLSPSQQDAVLDEPTPHLRLQDLLTSPFMRVSKYVWLLSAILRATPAGHPDNLVTGHLNGQRLLASAVKAVQGSLNAINNSVIIGSNLALLSKLQEKFSGSPKDVDICAPHRFLVREGMLLRQTRKGATHYYFHLFTDLLIYSDKTVSGFKIHRRMPLITVQVLDSGKNNELEIHSPQKSFVVIAASEGEKDSWLEDIMIAVKNEIKRQAESVAMLSPASAEAPLSALSQRETVMLATAPLWDKDSTVDACPFCQKKFTAVFNRRHHCRFCGRLCCAPCSKQTRLIPNIDKTKPQRVCDSCAAKP